MPATEAQVRANRENAQKSTGPKTEAGKARARMNALKHGMRSKGGLVLPHEDPAELEAKIDLWIADWQPQNAIERELVERAARASWALERAERCEAALISEQVRKAVEGARARRAAGVDELGKKLLQGPDDPAAAVAALEGSPRGARWLLGRWEVLRGMVAGEHEWSFFEKNMLVRLLGKHPFDAVVDPGLNAVFVAWDVLEGGEEGFWEFIRKRAEATTPAFGRWAHWRELGPRPADEAEAWARLGEVVERESARLRGLLAGLEEVEEVEQVEEDGEDDALAAAEAASFLAGDAGERLRRHQSARSRELFRAVQLLAKLRKDAASREHKTSSASSEKDRAASVVADISNPPVVPPPLPPGEGGRAAAGEGRRSAEGMPDANPSRTARATAERDDPHPALRATFSRGEKGGDGLAASKNATNEPDNEEAEAWILKEVKLILAEAEARKRTRPGAAAC